MKSMPLAALLLALALPLAAPAQEAAGTTPLPEWDQLPQARRDAMVAPLRERWNRNPGDRGRMLDRAARWQSLSPEERGRAQRGMQRWEHMDPARREQMRALFERTRNLPPPQRREAMALFRAMRGMTPAQREGLKRQWGGMSPDQRAQWMRENAPPRNRQHRDGGGRNGDRGPNRNGNNGGGGDGGRDNVVGKPGP